jgi:hypothetical protein
VGTDCKSALSCLRDFFTYPSDRVLKPSILKIDDYTNLLESINKSSNISAIAKEDRLLVEAFIEKTKSTLISEGKFDGAMTLKYDNAISKLRLGVNITNQESMVSRLISNYPKLENILSKTKNQLTFESATGILKYNGKAIANITNDAKDVVLSTQKVANIDRTAANMEAFTEEAAIFCKNGNCDLVIGDFIIEKKLEKILEKTESLANLNNAVKELENLKPKFLEDFANASEEFLKGLNDDIFNSWKNFRKNYPLKSLCK